jgi:hypothetical protein
MAAAKAEAGTLAEDAASSPAEGEAAGEATVALLLSITGAAVVGLTGPRDGGVAGT